MSKIFNYLVRESSSTWRKSFLELFERDPSARLLDLGCGDGTFTIEVAQRIGTKYACGVDYNMERVDKARARGINALVADLNKPLPLESESLDVICVSDVIDFVPSIDTCIREAYRVLSREGYMVISARNLAAMHCIFLLLIGRQPPVADVSNEIGAGALWIWKKAGSRHIYRAFTLSAFKELIEYHKFKVQKTLGVGFYPFPVKLANVFATIDKRHASYLCLKARKT